MSLNSTIKDSALALISIELGSLRWYSTFCPGKELGDSGLHTWIIQEGLGWIAPTSNNSLSWKCYLNSLCLLLNIYCRNQLFVMLKVLSGIFFHCSFMFFPCREFFCFFLSWNWLQGTIFCIVSATFVLRGTDVQPKYCGWFLGLIIPPSCVWIICLARLP